MCRDFVSVIRLESHRDETVQSGGFYARFLANVDDSAYRYKAGEINKGLPRPPGAFVCVMPRCPLVIKLPHAGPIPVVKQTPEWVAYFTGIAGRRLEASSRFVMRQQDLWIRGIVVVAHPSLAVLKGIDAYSTQHGEISFRLQVRVANSVALKSSTLMEGSDLRSSRIPGGFKDDCGQSKGLFLVKALRSNGMVIPHLTAASYSILEEFPGHRLPNFTTRLTEGLSCGMKPDEVVEDIQRIPSIQIK
ncbi:hypothetical protein CSUB01_11533 [Colletotrichum sublineola]|uniref:Uncharacterized protein n=1 Tax=Colletotrichum sublineola TaxID=1173701 RepID=A0A066Y2H4_COLSU|nr:hypothetical protein CSUB01_11533 [Colletotrichum sublineola]